jgi:hypothetical protein
MMRKKGELLGQFFFIFARPLSKMPVQKTGGRASG